MYLLDRLYEADIDDNDDNDNYINPKKLEFESVEWNEDKYIVLNKGLESEKHIKQYFIVKKSKNGKLLPLTFYDLNYKINKNIHIKKRQSETVYHIYSSKLEITIDNIKTFKKAFHIFNNIKSNNKSLTCLKSSRYSSISYSILEIWEENGEVFYDDNLSQFSKRLPKKWIEQLKEC